MTEQAKKLRGRISGAWKKDGKFGKFFKGKFTRTYLLEQLAQFPEDVEVFDFYISPLEVKQKDSDPDILATFTEHVPYEPKG